jgi:proline iminopeptidase
MNLLKRKTFQTARPLPSRTFLALAVTALCALVSCSTLDPHDPGNLVPKTVEHDNSLPSIKVNGTHLHAETFGNSTNPLLLMLHGGPGGDYRSILNAQALAKDGFYVVFYDQRGCGLSKRYPRKSIGLAEMLGDLKGVINFYRTSPTQKVILLGHSWGAMLATAYVNTYPSEIDGVIMIEPGGFTQTQVTAYFSRGTPDNLFGDRVNDVLSQDQFFAANEHNHELLDYKYGLLGNVYGFPHFRLGYVANADLLTGGLSSGFNFTDKLGEYKRKTLFLYSDGNKRYGTEHAQLLSSAYPNVVLQQIPNSVHTMILHNWEAMYPEVRSYLSTFK